MVHVTPNNPDDQPHAERLGRALDRELYHLLEFYPEPDRPISPPPSLKELNRLTNRLLEKLRSQSQ